MSCRLRKVTEICVPEPPPSASLSPASTAYHVSLQLTTMLQRQTCICQKIPSKVKKKDKPKLERGCLQAIKLTEDHFSDYIKVYVQKETNSPIEKWAKDTNRQLAKGKDPVKIWKNKWTKKDEAQETSEKCTTWNATRPYPSDQWQRRKWLFEDTKRWGGRGRTGMC